jgi:PAS domain S-box-containing protein
MFSSQAHFNHSFSEALIDGRIVPYFQPIVSLQDGTIASFEVLARWKEAGRAYISPSLFIPRADRGGMLDELLLSLMRQTFTVAKDWPGEVPLAFNVSPSQLHRPRLVDEIRQVTTEYEFPPSRLGIEVIETAILDNKDEAGSILEQLISMGCSISLDDFGTGYSSLTWLATLPFSRIKIDTSFVRTMLAQRESRKIVTSVVGLGLSLGLSVVAEGVETVEAAEFLRSIGCPFAQGFLFGRPMPATAVPKALHKPPGVKLSANPMKLSLEQRVAQISALYQAEEVSIGFIDTDLVVVDVSEALAKRLGKTLSEVIGHYVYDFAPKNVPSVDFLRSCQLNGLPYPSFELPLPSGDTDLVTVLRVHDEANELIGYSIVGIDITAHKQAVDALRESEERFRVAALLSPRTTWQVNAEGYYVSFDESYAQMTGVTSDAAKNMTWLEFVSPDDRDRAEEKWKRSLQTGDIFDEELRCRASDGHYRWFRTYLAPRCEADGQILYWYGQKEDIDSRKHAQEKLRDKELEFRFIVENSPFLPFVTDPEGKALSISSRLASIFNITAEEAMEDHGWFKLVHPSQRDAVREHWFYCLGHGKVFDMDYQLKFRDGAYRWMYGWCAPRFGQNGEILGWYGTISELRLPRLPAPVLPDDEIEAGGPLIVPKESQ